MTTNEKKEEIYTIDSDYEPETIVLRIDGQELEIVEGDSTYIQIFGDGEEENENGH